MAGRSPGTSHASQAIERAIRDRAQELGVGAAELEKLVIDSFFLQD
jgi:CO/xanthine dehydrogenase Mo-binding subunit